MISAPVLPLLIPFLLILTRLSSTLLLLPSFSLVTGSIRIKLLLAAMGAFLLTPLHIRGDWSTVSSSNLLFMVESELLLGFACGLAGRLIISGLLMAGQLIGQVSGISLSELRVADENVPHIRYVFSSPTKCLRPVQRGAITYRRNRPGKPRWRACQSNNLRQTAPLTVAIQRLVHLVLLPRR